jgi:hypothetical protein
VYNSVKSGRRTEVLVRKLVDHCTQQHIALRLWCVSMFHTDIPECLQQEVLSTPLRSAPAVVREVVPALAKYANVMGYSDSGLPAPGDGPKVIRLHHAGAGHTGRWPVECPACGQNVARELTETLGVAQAGERFSF